MDRLVIKDLRVRVDDKEIIRGLNLTLKKGEVAALMGPNGSGKSTLANTLLGHPKCSVTSGEILFEGKNIMDLTTNERAKLGIFLSFQHPQEISGVTLSNFLKISIDSQRGENNRMRISDFKKICKEKLSSLSFKDDFLQRYLNSGFSGGEKKKSEILQMLLLDPNLAILDETDSGLDIDALRIVSQGVNAFKGPDKSVLIITHYKRILEHIKPDRLFIMIDGRIALEGKGGLADHLEEKGYGWIREDS